MNPITRGIYETILTEALDKELATLSAGYVRAARNCGQPRRRIAFLSISPGSSGD